MSSADSWLQCCPIPISADAQRVSLAHGEGARLTRQLLSHVILPRMMPQHAPAFADAAVIGTSGRQLAVCSDGHTVTPLFFPGGDLGSLAVYGTVNDLAVAGATPAWLTVSLIIEEGLPIPVLERLLDSLADAAQRCHVRVISGDTKVVPRGAADGLFITTSGIGELTDGVPSGPASIQTGDKLLVSGPIGRHGIAVLCARESLGLEPVPHSDSCSLIEPVRALRNAAGPHLRAMRDATRGGVSAVLHEWAVESGRTMELSESLIPITPDVRGTCELLGLDPLHVANEGTFVSVVAAEAVDTALTALKAVPGFELAAVIGEVRDQEICPVTIRRTFGVHPLDEPSGAPLPRIC